MRFVEFQVETYENGLLVQKGWIDMESIHEEEIIMGYYDEKGLESPNPRKNPYKYSDKEYNEWEETMQNWIADQDNFIKFAEEFQDEPQTIIGHDYILLINGGDDY